MPERKTLNEDLFYRGSSANLPRLHTCKNKVPFWDFSQFAVTPSILVPLPILWGLLLLLLLLLLLFTPLEFFTSLLGDGISLEFVWQQVSASLLKSPGLFSVFWPFSVMLSVSTRPPTSKSYRPFNNPLVIVPKAPITIGTIVTFVFHSFKIL